MAELLGRLHGRKHLITGNNDSPATTSLAGWSSVRPYAELELNGFALVLCHYPFRTWRNMSRGWLNLHGHSHGRLAPLLRQTDVGVDRWNFRPVTLAQITAAKRPRARAMRSS
jgi:calcineurin-like phosphoesterase family protein